MSAFVENTTNWRVSEEEYEINYNLTYSVNDVYEEFELWEYGIQCELLDRNKQIVSTAEVKHISSNCNYVLGFIQKITDNKVFPIHLVDVVSDLLEEECLI
ncbi:DUF6514 family protein [Clostridium sp. Marseille-P299]|uniref:DUF6514 family protein n=1 Tax=Clostridium sp. Marseille-P299 TaxID=1805477 RepID=UPI00082F7F14|nr:DUF6514 family protein [Clostridium sp. Marseille-P299]